MAMSRLSYAGIGNTGQNKNRSILIAPKSKAVLGKEMEEKEILRRTKQQMISLLNRNVELKYYSLVDNTYGSISYNGTDFMQLMTGVPQGDTDQTRDGDRLFLKKFRFRVGCKIGTTTPVFLRVICFQWFPTTTPVYANILLDQHNTSCAPLSDFTHDTRQEYKILSDDLVQLDTVAHPAYCVERSIEYFPNPNIQFQSGGTSGTNHLYVMAVSDVASSGPQVVLFTKTLFTDS
jgi:hypothetical protein